MQADPYPQLNVLKDRPLDVVAVKETRTIKRNLKIVLDRICLWAEGVPSSFVQGTVYTTSPKFLFYRRMTVASCLLILMTMVSAGATKFKPSIVYIFQYSE